MPQEPDETTIIPSKLGKALAHPTIVTPKIIEEGKEVVRPDVVQAVVQLATLGQLTKIRKSLEKEEYEGKEDPRTLSATDKPQFITFIREFPYVPWIGAYFINDGPDPVRISINRPYTPFTLALKETVTVNRAHADERIKVIYYVCDPGETASFRAIGAY
ncbi:hypothetical protein ES703_98397 [subsurface metagenome]